MRHFAAVVCVVLFTAACSSPEPQPNPAPPAASPAPAPGSSTPAAAPVADEPLPDVPSPYDALPPATREVLERPFTGDLDEMVKRRLIRAGVVFNKTQYFVDRGQQRGFVYDAFVRFEEELNRQFKTGQLKVHVAFVPMQRDQLFKALQDGKVDLVAAALTVTPEREKVANFSKPTRSGVKEIVVGGRGAAPVKSAEDLSGREVFIRRSSSYYESVTALNTRLATAGRPPVIIKEAPEALEDEDLLEMVNAGLVDLTIVDDFMAQFWTQVFQSLQVFEAAAVRTGGIIAVGMRKGSPRLEKTVNMWIDKYGPKTAFGNLMERAYLQRTDYVQRASDEAERKKFEGIVHLFRTYSDKYQLDFLLMAAQGYQESRLDQNARSQVGAIGVMQVMPGTGKDMAVGDIKQMEPNIHAGVKYVRFMMDQYFKDEPMDEINKALMTFASYNAGPARVRGLRRETAKRGLNPNLWFGNVERIASEKIGRETVQYVSNIYKYYVAYRLLLERKQAREGAKQGGAGR